MSTELTIKKVENPGSDEWSAIGYGISDHNKEKAGDEDARRICYVLHDEDSKIVGGVIGAVYWTWFYVDLMWIREEFRRQGYGLMLLVLAENEARAQGAQYAYLDTFSFQAPGFYQKFGYEEFGRLEDFPEGHSRYFLKKTL